MSALPSWIEQRIDLDSKSGEIQAQLVEAILRADQPFLSTQRLCSAVTPDVDDETVLDQLTELRDRNVVATTSYVEPITLYYIHDPNSGRSPAADSSRLPADNPLDRLSLRGFLTFRDTAGVRTLVLAGFQLSLVLVALGTVLTVAGFEAGAESDFVLWDSAFDLFGVCLLLLFAEGVTRRMRSGESD